jgi:hypothetical protein
LPVAPAVPVRAVLACAGLVTASCGVGTVELEPAELPDDERILCDRLLADLPSQVAGGERRDVSPYGAGAAWGDPPITLRCGTTDAQGMSPAMACQVVDGVGWYAEELEHGYRFTTIGRQTYVEVVVPDTGDQASAALVDLAPAVRGAVPEVRPCV